MLTGVRISSPRIGTVISSPSTKASTKRVSSYLMASFIASSKDISPPGWTIVMPKLEPSLAGFTTNDEAGETHFFVINDGSESTNAYIYKFVDDGSADDATNVAIDGTELTLIGTMTTDDSATTVDDIVIA